MSWRTYYWDDLADDERHAIANGLRLRAVPGLRLPVRRRTCPRCKADEHAEHLLDTARCQVGATWAEEHEEWEGAA